jgi:hypothetical protein
VAEGVLLPKMLFEKNGSKKCFNKKMFQFQSLQNPGEIGVDKK